MQALFIDYLMHFCGKNKTPRQAQAVLESILKRRQFIASKCPLFNDPDGELERRHLQAWASMVCFTDLRFQDLEQHLAKFGPYGIALKKESVPAGRCDPVHYVKVGSQTQENSHMLSEGIRRLLALQREGKLDANWEFPRQLKEFDDRRCRLAPGHPHAVRERVALHRDRARHVSHVHPRRHSLPAGRNLGPGRALESAPQ